MSTPIDQLERWVAGMKSVRADDMNAIIEWIQRRNLSGIRTDGTEIGYSGPLGTWGSVARGTEEEWIGQIVKEGPEEEPNFKDARYWVRRGQVINRARGDRLPREIIRLETYDRKDVRSRWITVTNLTELSESTHNLEIDAWVVVERTFDLNRPRQKRYYMQVGGAGGERIFRARVDRAPIGHIIEVEILDFPEVGKASDISFVKTFRFPEEVTLDHVIPFLRQDSIIPVTRISDVQGRTEGDSFLTETELSEFDPEDVKTWYCTLGFQSAIPCP